MTEEFTVVSLSSNPWTHPYWTSRQFLMYQLSQLAPVWYATNRTYVRNLWTASFWRGSRLRPPVPPYPPPPGLRVVRAPISYPHVPGYPRVDRYLARRYGKFLRRLVGSSSRRLVAYVWEPHFVDYLYGLDADRVVYHPYDKFDVMDEDQANVARIQANERRLIALADAVITPHRRIAEGLGHPNAHVVHNGVFLHAFRDEQNCHPAAAVQEIPPPRIGYLGVLNAKVDFELLLQISRKRPDWSLVLIGLIEPSELEGVPGFQEIQRQSNVRFVPPVPFNRVPAFMRGLNLGVIPYDLSRWAAFSESPLKLYQYWAAGLPIVSSALPNMVHEPGVLSIATSPEEWISRIEWELSNDSDTLREQRYAKAEESSWLNRADRVARIIRDLL